MSIDLFAELKIGLDGLASEQRHLRERLERKPPQPTDIPLGQSAPAPSSGVLAMNLGGPDQGYVWSVRRLAVGGQTPTTTEAGRADIFVVTTYQAILASAPGAADSPGRPGFQTASGLAGGSLQHWRDQAAVLPRSAFYGTHEMIVKANQSLWVVFSSVTSTDVLIAAGAAEMYRESDYTATVGL